LAAIVAALILRGFFLWQFPYVEGDSKLYSALAYNLLDHGVYGIFYEGRLVPVDIRMPGYPLFLAGIAALFGRNPDAVGVIQALLDVISCLLTALVAYRLAPETWRVRAGLAALWLTALCPFTANYTVTPLAETPTILCTMLAILLFLDERWVAGGLAAGVGCLFRPEAPLVAAAVGFWLLAARRWRELIPAGLRISLGVFLALLPWGLRNWITLHEVQFLTVTTATMPEEVSSLGYGAWTGTWLWRAQDIEPFSFRMEEEPVPIEALPEAAFDSPEEKARVVALFEDYNQTTVLTPAMDAAFAQLAKERRARHPIRIFLLLPVCRAWTLWFGPRTELLPFSGDPWEFDPVDFTVTQTFRVLNFLFIGLGLAGVYRLRRNPAVVLLLAFILLRTALMTQVAAPEPRYVVPCFPALLAMGAMCFYPWRSTGPA
jgi:4-amino-4-deoxy-L-arabinose transferase-like glycosyltransferase